MTLPLIVTTEVPRDYWEPGNVWGRRWLYQDAEWISNLIDRIDQEDAALEAKWIGPEDPSRVQLRRARSVLAQALATVDQRQHLTWEHVHAAHVAAIKRIRRWYETHEGYTFEFADFLVYSNKTQEEEAYERQVWGDGSVHEFYKLDGNAEWQAECKRRNPSHVSHPYTWLAAAPQGYGGEPNSFVPVTRTHVMQQHPDWLEQPNPTGDPVWFRAGSAMRNLLGQECLTENVCAIAKGGWFGTFPRVRGYPSQNSIAIYGAEPYMRWAVTGIPDAWHYAFGDQTPEPDGESHEGGVHSPCNLAAHSAICGIEPDSWCLDFDEQTGPFNNSLLTRDGAGWLNSCQKIQMHHAATAEGDGRNPILTKIPLMPEVVLVREGDMVRPIVRRADPLWPQGGELRWYVNGGEIGRAPNDSPRYIPATFIEQAVRCEFRAGVNRHGYGADGAVYFGQAEIVVPAIAVEPPPPPPPPPPPSAVVLESIEVLPKAVLASSGDNGTFTCVAKYSDGSKRAVVANYKSSNTKKVVVNGESWSIPARAKGTAQVVARYGETNGNTGLYTEFVFSIPFTIQRRWF